MFGLDGYEVDVDVRTSRPPIKRPTSGWNASKDAPEHLGDRHQV